MKNNRLHVHFILGFILCLMMFSITTVKAQSSVSSLFSGELTKVPIPVVNYAPGKYKYPINSPIVINSPLNIGQYSQPVSCPNGINCYCPAQFENINNRCYPTGTVYTVSPELPAGLFLNSSTGVIFGTPTIEVPETNYTITRSNSCNQSSSCQINITTFSNPTILIQPASAVTLCALMSPLKLSVTTTGTSLRFQWRFNGVPLEDAYGSVYGSTNRSLLITMPDSSIRGTYDVVIKGLNNDSIISTVSTVNIITPPGVSISASGPTTFCGGNTVSLSSQLTAQVSGLTYNWIPGNLTTPNIQAVNSGNYKVEITDGVGCKSFSNTIVVDAINPNASIDKSTSKLFYSGQTAYFKITGANNSKYTEVRYSLNGQLDTAEMVNDELFITIPNVTTDQILQLNSVLVSDINNLSCQVSLSQKDTLKIRSIKLFDNKNICLGSSIQLKDSSTFEGIQSLTPDSILYVLPTNYNRSILYYRVPSATIWSSSDSSVARVSNNGLITSLKEGTSTISLTHKYEIRDTISIGRFYSFVLKDSVIVVIGKKSSYISGNANVCFSSTSQMTVTNPNNGLINGWKSADTSILTITANGLVSGNRSGLTKIFYSAINGCVDTFSINIRALPYIIGVDTTRDFVICKGTTKDILVTDPYQNNYWPTYINFIYVWDNYNAFTTSFGNPVIANFLGSRGIGGTPGGHTLTLGGLNSGATTLTYADRYGCSLTKNIVVNEALITSGRSALCGGDSTQLIGSGVPDSINAWESNHDRLMGINALTGVAIAKINDWDRYDVPCKITYKNQFGCLATKIIKNIAEPFISFDNNINLNCQGKTSNLYVSYSSPLDSRIGETFSSADSSIVLMKTSNSFLNVGVGTTIIKYKSGLGCTSEFPITVKPTPIISGNRLLGSCQPTATLTASGGTLGTWSCYQPVIQQVANEVFINQSSRPYLTYTNQEGCAASAVVEWANSLSFLLSPPSYMLLGQIQTISVSYDTFTTSNRSRFPIHFVSSDTSIIKILSENAQAGSCVIKAISSRDSVGHALITAVDRFGCSVSTDDIRVYNNVTINGNKRLCVGSTNQLTATGNTPALVNVWQSQNPAVASVSSTGLVTAIAKGMAYISYTDILGRKTYIDVWVNGNPKEAPTDDTYRVKVGDSVKILFDDNVANNWNSGFTNNSNSGYYLGRTIADMTNNLSFSISNPSVASLIGNGIIYPSAGAEFRGLSSSDTGTTVTITVSDSLGCTSTFPLLVYPATSIEGNTTLCNGSTSQLTSSNLPAATNAWRITGTNSNYFQISDSGLLTSIPNNIQATIIGTVHFIDIYGQETSTEIRSVPRPMRYSAQGGFMGGYSPITLCPGDSTLPSYGVFKYSSSDSLVAYRPYRQNNLYAVGEGTAIITAGYYSPELSGCTSTFPFTVKPKPVISGDTVICQGSTTTLTASGTLATTGAWAFSAYPSSITQQGVVTAIHAGINIITCTNSLGCSATASMTVLPQGYLSDHFGSQGLPTLCINGETRLNYYYLDQNTSNEVPLNGTMNSSNPPVVSVRAADYTLKGLSEGSSQITYTHISGCTTPPVTIIVDKPEITGISDTICVGSTAVLHGSGSASLRLPMWSSNSSILDLPSSTWTYHPTATQAIAIAPGTATITYNNSNGCIANKSIVVLELPVISGRLNLCLGDSSRLYGSGSPASVNPWQSSNPAVASVTSDGLVTALAEGTASITYTIANGCSSSVNIVISSVNPTISGADGPFCNTGFQSSLSGSGIADANNNYWSSSDLSVVNLTYDRTSAIITPLASGSSIITFRANNGCLVNKTVVVENPAILGAGTSINNISYICENSIIQLTATGGAPALVNAWTSSDTDVASVSNDGVVTAIHAGTAYISYHTIGGCSSYVAKRVNINPTPAGYPGSLNFCVGNPTPLMIITGLNFSNDSIITIDNFNRRLIPQIAGNTFLTVTDQQYGCVSSPQLATVFAAPIITGASSLCTGDTMTMIGFGNPALINPWTSSDTAVARIDSTGLVTGIGSGHTTITYQNSNGCSVTKLITTIGQPSISGNLQSCMGDSYVTVYAHADYGFGENQSFTISDTSIAEATGWDGNTHTLLGKKAGTTQLTYTSSGCSVSEMIVIKPTPVISGPLKICGFDSTIQLTATGSPTGINVWTSSDTSVAIVSTAGEVRGSARGTSIEIATITCTNSNGCAANANIYFYPAIRVQFDSNGTLTATNPFLFGVGQNPIRIEPSYYEYYNVYSSNPSVSLSNSGHVKMIAFAAGSSVITIVDRNSGCSSSATVNAINPPEILDAADLCAGSSLQLSSADSPAIINPWLSSDTTIATVTAEGMITGVRAGNSKITYTNSLGISNFVIIKINQIPSFDFPQGITTCPGRSQYFLSQTTADINSRIVAITSSDFSVAIPHQNTYNGVLDFIGISEGNAIIKATNGYGCSASQTVTVLPMPEITGSLNICSRNASAVLSHWVPSELLSNQHSSGYWSTTADVHYINQDISGEDFVITPRLDNPLSEVLVAYRDIKGCFNSVTVTFNDSAIISGAVNICKGSTSSLSANVARSPETPWTSSDTSVATINTEGLVTGINAGTSTITYTTSSGCSATVLITVSENNLSLTGETFVCPGGNTLSWSANGSPAINNAWTSSNTSVAQVSGAGVVTSGASGTAYITYNSNNGCSTGKNITVYLAPTITASRFALCQNDSIQLTGSGFPALTNAWTSSNTEWATVSSNGLVKGGTRLFEPGVVSMLYTDHLGCKATKNISISRKPYILGVDYACAGIAIGLQLSLFDENDGGFTWSSSNDSIATVNNSGGMNVTVNPLSYGISTIACTNRFGCTGYKDVEITAPVFKGPFTLCGVGETVVLDVSGISPSHSKILQSSNPSVATISFDNANNQYLLTKLAQGTTQITIMDASRDYCSASANYTIVVPVISGKSTICLGSTSQLTCSGVPAVSSTWYSANTSVAMVSSNGLVTGVALGTTNITYTDSSGCFATIIVSVSGYPVITADGPVDICKNGQVRLNASPVDNGRWNEADIHLVRYLQGYETIVINGGITGSAQIYYTDSKGCKSNTLVVTVYDPKIINLPDRICQGTPIYLSSSDLPATVNPWVSSDTSIASITNEGVLTGIANGTATITFTNKFGCSVSSQVYVRAKLQASHIPLFGTICSGTNRYLNRFLDFVYDPYLSPNSLTSSNPSVLSVNGLLAYALSPGTSVLTVYDNFGCSSISEVVTVDSPYISGSLNLCGIGDSTLLTGSGVPATTNAWSMAPDYGPTDAYNHIEMSNSGVTPTPFAVVSALAGWGNQPLGTCSKLIYYTTNFGCTASASITLNPIPTITGISSLCVGKTGLLIGSGTPAIINSWSSSNNQVATVSNEGLATGISAGTANITYTISGGCSVMKSITIMPDQPTYSTETIEACGSYNWHGVTYTASNNTATWIGVNAIGCDSLVTLHLTIKVPTTSIEVISACNNYNWHGVNYTSSTNTATWTGTNAAGCDSIVTLHLTIKPASSSIETVSACNSYLWHGVNYTSSNNTATWTGTNAAGCDSIVTLNLTIKYASYSIETVSSCGSYVWHGRTYTSSNNTATWTGTNAAGCDSIVTLNLTIKYASYSIETVSACGSYVWHGREYSSSSNTASWFAGTNAAGCDSIVLLNLTINQPSTIVETVVACDSFSWHENTYTASNSTAIWTGNNAAGCDSVVTLNLTIKHSSTSTESISACNSYLWHGVNYTSSTNTATWIGTNAAGCDSIVKLHLTIKPASSSIETVSACSSYDWHGATYTSSNNTASWTGTNAVGCDSTVTLNLTIHALPIITIDGASSICLGDSSLLTASGTGEDLIMHNLWSNGDTSAAIIVKAAGDYMFTGVTAFGCSTTVSKTVAVNICKPTATISGGTDTWQYYGGYDESMPHDPAFGSYIHTDPTICVGSSVDLKITLTGNRPWHGELSDGTLFNTSTSPFILSVHPSTTTTYSIVSLYDVTNLQADANDLTGSALVNVRPYSMAGQAIQAAGPTTFCVGDQVTLSVNELPSTILPVDQADGVQLAVSLRKLRSGYTGPALRLVRSSDNVEADFGFIGNELDVSAINTWLNGSDAYCKYLYNQSSTNGDVIGMEQNDLGAQPLFVANGMNGRPILHFSTSQYMETPYTPNYLNQYSILYGAKITGASGSVLTAKNYSWIGDEFGGSYQDVYNDNSWSIGYRYGSKDWASFSPEGNALNNDYTIYASTHDYYDSYASIYKNGAVLRTGSSGALDGLRGLRLNGFVQYGWPYMDMSDFDFTELIAYPSSLSSDIINSISNSNAFYYGGQQTQLPNNYTYLWSNGETTPTINANISGNYAVTVTNENGCTITTDSTLVTVNSCGQISGAELTGNAAICNGTSTQLSIALTGFGPWQGTLSDGTQFSGSTSPILITVSPSQMTTYSIVSITANNVPITASRVRGSAIVDVHNPTSSITNYAACASSMPYYWNGIARTSAGTYTYTTSNANGCDSLATLILTVSSATPAAPTAVTQTLVSNVCGARVYRYTVTAVTNALGYSWTLPTSVGGVSGVTIDSGNVSISRIIKVRYESNAAAINGDSIKVRAYSGCGFSAYKAAKLSNTALNVPTAPTAITITSLISNVCGNRVYRYSVPALPVAGATSSSASGYVWEFVGSLSEYATIDSGDVNSQKIIVSYTTNAPSAIGDSIKFYYTSDCGNSLTKAAKLTNTALKEPAAPSAITITALQTNVCGARKYRYSAPNLPTASTTAGVATGYVWNFVGSLASTMTIDSGDLNSQRFTVTFTSNAASAAGDSVRVYYTSDCGNSLRKTAKLSNTALVAPAVASAVTITALQTTVCNARKYRYSAPNLPSATTTAGAASGYVWDVIGSLASTMTIDSGDLYGQRFTVTFTSNAASAAGDSVRVLYTTAGCGNSTRKAAKLSNTSLVAPAAPTSITISLVKDICGARVYRYTAPALAIATTTAGAAKGYLWSMPSGTLGLTGVLDSGSLTSSVIRIRYSSNAAALTGDSIKVLYTSDCGNSPAKAQKLSNLSPTLLAASATLTGTTSICTVVGTATSNRYIASAVTGAVSYTWTLPVGAVLDSGSNGLKIKVRFLTAGANDSIYVQAVGTNGCAGTKKVLKLVTTGCVTQLITRNNLPSTIKTSIDPMSVNVYPNPTTNAFQMFVKTPTASKITMRVLDVQGRLIKTISFNSDETIAFGNDLKSGVYMVEVREGNVLKTVRVVKY